jgi:hypothetical protein
VLIALVDGSGVLDAVDLGDGTDGFIGPDGWLDGCADRILLVTVHDGTVSLERVDSPPPSTEAQIAAIRAAFARGAETLAIGSDLVDQRAIEVTISPLDDLLRDALLVDRDAFLDAAVPPIDRLLDSAELEREDQTVAERGTDWEAWNRWRRRTALERIHGLDDEHACPKGSGRLIFVQ